MTDDTPAPGSTAPGSSARRPRSRAVRVVRRVGIAALAAGLVALLGFVIWALNPMRAEPKPLAALDDDTGIAVTRSAAGVVLIPKQGATGAGFVMLPGARVEPEAYAAKLRGLADAGVVVVIPSVTLNFALFDTRSFSDLTQVADAAGATEVQRWYVGGHSLGGVRACQLVADDRSSGRDAIAGLVLLGSYCAADISSTDAKVLSLGGSRDGLSTPAKIQAARHLLPDSATLVEIRGADHASFGDYGEQPGDKAATASDRKVASTLTQQVLVLMQG
ncbi:alpha/beta hydrolase [Schumannella soli]|nr:alpha/beta hydrolase [Schumannella soli]